MNKLVNVLACATLAASVGCGGSLSGQDHIDRARAYIAKSQFPAAEIELRNAVRKSDEKSVSRLLLAETLLQAGKPAEAETELVRLDKGGAQSDKGVALLARALQRQYKADQARALQIPGIANEEMIADVLVSRAMASLQQGDLRAARLHLEEASELGAPTVYYREALARLELVKGNVMEAKTALREIVSSTPDYAPAWKLLGRLEQESGNNADALSAYRRLVELQPGVLDGRLRLSLSLIAAGQHDDAETQVSHLEARHRDQVGVSYARGLLHYHQGDYIAAQPVFTDILAHTDNFLPAVLYAAVTHLKLGDYEIAEQLFDRYLVVFPNHPQANRLLAILKNHKGEYAEAEQLLSLSLEEEPESIESLSSLAYSNMAQGDFELGIATLEEIIELRPDLISARVALASAQGHAGRHEQAEAGLLRAIEMDPDMAIATARLARLYLAKGESDKAIELAKDYVITHQQSATAHNLLASIYLSNGQDDLAAAAFFKAQAIRPSDLSANGGLAAIAERNGDIERSRAHYQAILEGHPGNLHTLLNLASLEAKVGNRRGATEALQAAIRSHPLQLEPRLKLATVYLLDGRAADVKALLDPVQQRHKSHVGILSLMGASAREAGSWNEVGEIYAKLTELVPGNATYHFFLAQSLVEAGDPGGYHREIGKALTIDPGLNIARADYARRLYIDGNFDEARAQLAFLQKSDYANVDVLQLHGKLQEQAGNFAVAAEAYGTVYSQQPTNINLLRLSKARWNIGERAPVVRSLESWLQDNPEDLLIKIELANRYMGLGQNELAVAAYESVLDDRADRKSPLALNNLAHLLRESDRGRALDYAEEALRLVPDSPQLMDTLSLLLIGSDRTQLQRAAKLNIVTREMRPENTRYLFREAQILRAMGKTEQARSALESLLGGHDDFADRAAAEYALSVYR